MTEQLAAADAAIDALKAALSGLMLAASQYRVVAKVDRTRWEARELDKAMIAARAALSKARGETEGEGGADA